MSSYNVKWVNGYINYKDTQNTMHIDTKRIWNMVVWTKVWETQMERIDDIYRCNPCVATPLLEECEDDTHTPEMETWESSETPKTSKFDCRGQNTSPWSAIYIIGKLSKCRCWKWPCMSHLDIYSTSYGKKKGHESNWQFDSWPLKVGN